MEVLCIGHSSMDTTLPVAGFPKENNKFRLKEKYECPGGPALTASMLLSKWGVNTYLSTVLGNDIEGEKILHELDEVGVNTKFIVRDDIDTTKTFIIVNKHNGSRTLFNTLDECEIKVPNYNIKPDIILVDGEYYEFAEKAYNKFKNAIKVIDAGKVNENVTRLCKESDYIICSKDFAEIVTKTRIDYNEPDTLKKVINELDNIYKGTVIVTLGERGCLYKHNDKTKIMGAIKVLTKDTTGAGDIFHGAFVYGLSEGLSLEKCLKIATIASGLSVKKYGASLSIPDIMEVHKIYAKNK